MTAWSKLRRYLLPGDTVVLLGSSGVGKSTLTNALMGTDVQLVREVREDDDRGRHTTTGRHLFVLPSGALLIDTPGLRSVGLWGGEDGLDTTFADIEAIEADCRFSDCRHETEPGLRDPGRARGRHAGRPIDWPAGQAGAGAPVDRAAGLAGHRTGLRAARSTRWSSTTPGRRCGRTE